MNVLQAIVDGGYARNIQAVRDFLRQTHPWLSGADVVLSHIRTQVPEGQLCNYLHCANVVGALNLAGNYGHVMEGATLPGMVGAFFALYSSCPTLTDNKVHDVLSAVQHILLNVECNLAKHNPCLTSETINELHATVCWHQGVYKYQSLSKLQVLALFQRALLQTNNAMVSALSIVWDEHYYIEGDACLTTWLPREIVEDIVHLSGQKGVEALLACK